VTGAAGFIGSHSVGALLERGYDVVGFDNLKTGSLKNIAKFSGSKSFKFVKGDLLNHKEIEAALSGANAIVHLAANPDVKAGTEDTKLDYEQNIHATYNLLEAMKLSGAKKIVFASTSTVYGDARVLPTPENYGPLMPISLYGASKLACEALVSGYSHSFGFEGVAIRLANVVGPVGGHGIIRDFLTKLASNQKTLEVLGDGTQSKSYLHIDDCVSALVLCLERSLGSFEVFNVGSEDRITVLEIAEIVLEELELHDVKIVTTKDALGGRGWVGDVKNMLLDVKKIRDQGWKPSMGSAEAVRQTVRRLLRDGSPEIKGAPR
jgi:UDP-glucose 4-epimerase